MSLIPIEPDPTETLSDADTQPDAPFQPASQEPAAPNAEAPIASQATPGGEDSRRPESLADFIERLRLEQGPATPARPAPTASPPPGGNVMMRLWSRMEPDLELQTGGNRVATYQEIHESLRNAARAEGIALPVAAIDPGQGQQVQPVSGPVPDVSSGQPAPDVGQGSMQPSAKAGAPLSSTMAPAALGAGGNPASSSSTPANSAAVSPGSAHQGTRDIVVKGDPAETAYVQSLTDEAFSRYQDKENWLQSLEPQTAQRDDSKLGVLSTKYETGGRGPGTVSTGTHDPGGISYGSYQFATNTGDAELAVASREFKRWAADFKGLAPGTKEFGDRWKEVTKRDPAAFQDAQHAYTKRSHYDPAVASIKHDTHLDFNDRSDAVRNAVWSVSVQHGKAVRILLRAVNHTDMMLKRTDPEYDKALIDNIYHDRIAYVTSLRNADLAEAAKPQYIRTQDPKLLKKKKGLLQSAQTYADLIKNRYPSELAEAQQMLIDEQSR